MDENIDDAIRWRVEEQERREDARRAEAAAKTIAEANDLRARLDAQAARERENRELVERFLVWVQANNLRYDHTSLRRKGWEVGHQQTIETRWGGDWNYVDEPVYVTKSGKLYNTCKANKPTYSDLHDIIDVIAEKSRRTGVKWTSQTD